jgi:virulence-associated protein VagC
VLGPVPESWDWLDGLVDEVDDDFVSAVREQPEATERPELDKVFR